MFQRLPPKLLLLLACTFAACVGDSALDEAPPDDAAPAVFPDDDPVFSETVVEPGEPVKPDPFTPPPIRPAALEWE